MKRLWAPWRMEYVSSVGEDGGSGGECIFCVAVKNDPDESLLLHKGKHSTVLLNKFPYNTAHVLISPIRHTAEVESLSVEESEETLRLIQHTVKVIKKELAPDGFNIGMNLGGSAGAGIADHLHWHVVPRWSGDTNFMPVLDDVRVMPEHIKSTLARLRPHFIDI
ncbi:MAG: HIT domain-containing protein [Deltaproteobacteria bacterium]|nr:HIT domain-containing protein [Deltaproteobacteria bacterium]